MIVEAAIQEDVHAIGISILSGAHMTIFPRIMQLMKEKDVADILLFGGGIIPESDLVKLREMGIGMLFTPGTSTQDIAKYLNEWVEQHPKN
jgi:methylmalonyl-CoA mutase C-terminal domain/subunit